ncbi:MAG TPA: phosphatase PAP2 family protein [Acidimicrobiales bacterium]
MIVLASVFAAAVVAGGAVVLAARRWPRLHIGAPRVDVASPLVQKEVDRHPRLRTLLAREIDPATATGLVLTVATAALLAGAVAVGLLLLMVQSHAGLAKWDLSLARWGGANATSSSTRVLRDISLIGGTAGSLVLATVVGVLEYRRRPNRAIPLLLSLTVLGQFAIVNGIKVLVGRERPDILRLTGFSGSSFPSGHSAAAAATLAVLALLLGRGRSRRTRNLLAGGAVALAVLVAGSRVMLGVHWFTDVLAGLCVGWAWLALCSIAFGGRLLRFGMPVEVAEVVAAGDASSTASGAAQKPLSG